MNRILVLAAVTTVAFLLQGTAVAVDSARPAKLVILGDSISTGVGASDPSKRYSTRILHALSQTEPNFQEVNLAISGSSLVDTAWPRAGASAYPHLIKKTIDDAPDILLIQHGTNDNTLGHSAGEFLWAYRQTVREIKLACPQTRIVCMTICPAWGVERCDDAWLQRVNVGIQEIGARENVLVAQTYLKLRHRKELFPDGVHPNDQGHAIIAESVLEALARNQVQTVTNFDFSVRGPGRFRLCGYEINISSPNPNLESGWVEIYGLGPNGFEYRSDNTIEILTPFRQRENTKKPDRHLILDGEAHPYFHYGKMLLPPTGGSTDRVLIEP